MLENTLRPPTDNLYKFGALAGVVVATLLLTLTIRELFQLQQAETEAVVELVAAGVPADATPDSAPDDAARALLVRRQLIQHRAAELQRLTLNSPVKHVIGGCLALSAVCFGCWLVWVQWPQDALLRHQIAATAPEAVRPRAGLPRALFRWWRRRRRKKRQAVTRADGKAAR